MSTQPTDEEIDAVTLEVLGYAALDKNTNETARLIARAVLAKWGTPAPARADSVQEDAARWHWLAEYLVGTRTDLDDEIVASETVNDLRKLVEAAIKQGGA